MTMLVGDGCRHVLGTPVFRSPDSVPFDRACWVFRVRSIRSCVLGLPRSVRVNRILESPGLSGVSRSIGSFCRHARTAVPESPAGTPAPEYRIPRSPRAPFGRRWPALALRTGGHLEHSCDGWFLHEAVDIAVDNFVDYLTAEFPHAH